MERRQELLRLKSLQLVARHNFFFGSFQPCALKIQPLNHFFSRNLKIERLKKGFKSVAPTTPSTLLKDKEEARIVSSSYIFKHLRSFPILFEII